MSKYRCPKLDGCKEKVDETKFEFVCIGFWEACDLTKDIIPMKTPIEWEETWEDENITVEEKEWIAYEEGWKEGYQDGILNFEATEKEKEKLRGKGLKVV